jgi:hypothetical protein
MFKVGDKVFIIRGSHQNETGVVTATDSWSGALTVDIDGWPGEYSINPEACIQIVETLGLPSVDLDGIRTSSPELV